MTVTSRLRTWATARHFAQLGIVGLLLATIRIPSELLRVPTLPLDRMMIGGILAAAFCLVSTLLHFAHLERLSVAVTLTGLAVLVMYKFWQLPELA